MKTIFVTGAAGMIGSAVCEMLLKKGFKVIATDNKVLKLYDHNFSFVECEINDKEQITSAMRDANVLMHLGCTVDNDLAPILGSEDEKLSASVDKFIYKTAVQYEFSDIIMLSTHQVYSIPKTREPVRESFETKPISTYGKMKLDSENALAAAIKKKNVNAVIIRPCPIYTKSFVENLVSKVRDPKDGSYFVYGYGDYGYSFCCLYNLIDLIGGIMVNESGGKYAGIYNAADTKPIMAKEIIEFLKAEFDVGVVQSRNYSSDSIKNQFTLFTSRPIKTEYRFSDPSIACSNISYDNTQARRFANFRWKLSNTK